MFSTRAISDTQTTDQYHLGFTMRFPRAMSIREDLSLTDCVTASGAVLHFCGPSSFLLLSIQLSWKLCVLKRKERWRTSLSLVFMTLHSILSGLTTYNRKSVKKKQKRTAKVVQYSRLAIQISYEVYVPSPPYCRNTRA